METVQLKEPLDKLFKKVKGLISYIDFETESIIHFRSEIQLNYKHLIYAKKRKTEKGKDVFHFDLSDADYEKLKSDIKEIQEVSVPIALKKWNDFEDERKSLGITDELLKFMEGNGHDVNVKSLKDEYYIKICWHWSRYRICKEFMKYIKSGDLDIKKLRFSQSLDYRALIQ